MKKRKLKPLAVTFALSGIWDVVAGIMYLLVIGNGRNINNPPIDPFYAIFLGSFFICFAYIQIMSAFNISRYLFNVGCLIIGRLFYVIVLYSHMLLLKDFPATFWATGLIDGMFILLYILTAMYGKLNVHDLFLPKRQPHSNLLERI